MDNCWNLLSLHWHVLGQKEDLLTVLLAMTSVFIELMLKWCASQKVILSIHEARARARDRG